MVRKTTNFTLNGEAVSVEADTDQTLLGTLRTDLEKTGTKYGCGVGMCGTCTVLIDGVPTRSCLTNLDYVQGKDVLTIEGMASGGELHPEPVDTFLRNSWIPSPGCVPRAVSAPRVYKYFRKKLLELHTVRLIKNTIIH